MKSRKTSIKIFVKFSPFIVFTLISIYEKVTIKTGISIIISGLLDNISKNLVSAIKRVIIMAYRLRFPSSVFSLRTLGAKEVEKFR